jgi:uncharacterized protein (TIGR02217 family)
MNGFDNHAHFPSALALGALAQFERRTDVQTFASGREARNALWAGTLRRWDAAGAVRGQNDLKALIAFFEARQGRLRAFRFRDPLCHRTGTGADPIPTDQTVGLGDGQRTAFPLYLGGFDGANPARDARRIFAPRAEGFRLALDGVAQLSGFALDTAGGVVSFDDAPASGVVISAGFVFDVPVRFDIDLLEVSLDGFGAGRAPHVPLIETVL